MVWQTLFIYMTKANLEIFLLTGWALQTTYYKDKIERLLFQLAFEQKKTRDENLKPVLDYLFDPPIASIKRMVRAANNVKTSDPELVRWMAAWDAAEEKRLKARLESIKYEIDATESLRLVCGSGRIEKVRNTLSDHEFVSSRRFL